MPEIPQSAMFAGTAGYVFATWASSTGRWRIFRFSTKRFRLR